jgi:ABC-2 type transport system permease protein
MALVGRSAFQARAVVLGAMFVLGAFQILLIAQAVTIEASQGFGRLADLIPGFLQRGLGTQALLLATFKGTVTFGYFHPVVVCLISLMAMYLATEPAHEVESGLVDLVLARSLPRRRLLTRSLLLALGAVVAVVVVMLIGTVVGLRWLAPRSPAPEGSTLLVLAINLIATAWSCAAIGLFIAAGSRRWTTAFTICAAIVIVGYLVDFLAIGWPAIRAVSWFFPFNYFPALYILGGTAWTARDLAVLFTATAVFTALAYWKFEKRDM